jgi:hypothetical protein
VRVQEQPHRETSWPLVRPPVVTACGIGSRVTRFFGGQIQRACQMSVVRCALSEAHARSVVGWSAERDGRGRACVREQDFGGSAVQACDSRGGEG